MQLGTTRFGTVTIDANDILLFPSGLIAFEDCQHWVILGDAENDAVGWLQCVSRPDVALPVVSPRRFVTDYQVRVMRSELAPLQLSELDQAYVLGIISRNEASLTLNLKAPVIINLDRHLGRQIITTDQQPVQFELTTLPVAALRKSA